MFYNSRILWAVLLIVSICTYFTWQRYRRFPVLSQQADIIAEMMEQNRRQFPDAEEVDVAQLLLLMQQSPIVLVDVRSDAERDVSLIPNAISAADFERNPSEFEGKTVVCYCTIGYRSAQYAQSMNRRGLRVASFNGSIVAWCQAGQRLTTPEGRDTKLVHNYGPQWNLLPPDFQAIW